MWELDCEEGWAPKNWCFWTVVLEETLESPLDFKEIQSVHPKGDQSWIFIGRINAEAETPILLATWCEELTHWKRPWCWEKLKVWGEGDERGWDGCMVVSPTWWTWAWANCGSGWWTGRPGVLQSMGSHRVRHDWATELILLLRKLYWLEQDFYLLYSSGTDRFKTHTYIRKFVMCQKALMPNN